MKFKFVFVAAVALLCLSCTERRTASTPVPDGDTIEVVIEDRHASHASDARRVIVVGPEAIPTDSIDF